MNSWLLAKTVTTALMSAGIVEVVLCPGSRSAALAVALERAERAGQLRLHVRADERSAGFLALGLAKASGLPVPVVCTSGTAVANLLPAAMEARHAGVPWLALTCDRPAYRIGTGASQTTDQSGLFGVFAVASLRVSSSSGRPAYWTSALARAIAAALGTRTKRPGPAQVNLEFSNPMLPPAGDESYCLDPAPIWPALAATTTAGSVELASGPKTVVLVGDATPSVGAEARAVAEVAGWPLLAEPTSNARTGPNSIARYRLLLAGELGDEIERVVTFGHPTLSRPVAALYSKPEVEHIVVADAADWFDVGASAAVVTDHVLAPADGGDAGWLSAWRKGDDALGDQLRADPGEPTGYSLAAAVVASVGVGAHLVLGASNPIRDADLAPPHPGPGTCWANRGLAGIDGTVATATGIALATGEPVTVLLGDLTFQHDIGSLIRSPGEPIPDLRIVVADDAGGSIFHTLEQGGAPYAASFERVFATPSGLDLVAVATGFGHRAERIDTMSALLDALAQPLSGIEVLVVSIERGSRRARDRALVELGRRQPEA